MDIKGIVHWYSAYQYVYTCESTIFSWNIPIFFFRPGSPSCSTSIVFLPMVSRVSKPPVITLLPVVSNSLVIDDTPEIRWSNPNRPEDTTSGFCSSSCCNSGTEHSRIHIKINAEVLMNATINGFTFNADVPHSVRNFIVLLPSLMSMHFTMFLFPFLSFVLYSDSLLQGIKNWRKEKRTQYNTQ